MDNNFNHLNSLAEVEVYNLRCDASINEFQLKVLRALHALQVLQFTFLFKQKNLFNPNELTLLPVIQSVNRYFFI
jgi:hypothetical protein